jgi:SOS-response transcriptional repressor LexA
MDPHIIESLHLEPSQDEFFFGNKLHRLVNLRGSPGVTELVSSTTYFILQVKGDSMNADQIDPGDFVLLRQQNSADQMDIVAAEIVNVDTEATLKRFLRKNGKIILEPSSTNPTHQAFTFNETARNFFIRGVALGVFKPA